jgi:hypothetical protein
VVAWVPGNTWAGVSEEVRLTWRQAPAPRQWVDGTELGRWLVVAGAPDGVVHVAADTRLVLVDDYASPDPPDIVDDLRWMIHEVDWRVRYLLAQVPVTIANADG